MNKIHPTAILEGDITLGSGNVIGAYCVLQGPLTLGDDNLISPQVCIGTPGEDTRNPRHDATDFRIEIGDRNIIREFTTVQKPCYGGVTQIRDDVFVMHGSHIPHDAILEDKVVTAPLAVIGGIARIMEGASLGMGCTIHQHSIVGPFSMVATNSAAIKNIRPFSRFIPGQPISVNRYAIDKFGFSEYAEEISAWVLHDVPPTSPVVVAIVDRWQSLHEASGRRVYR